MSSQVMVGNHTGWESRGAKLQCAPIGDGADTVAIELGKVNPLDDEEAPVHVYWSVGESHDCLSGAAKRRFNQGFNKLSPEGDPLWIQEAGRCMRTHINTGALITIEFNVYDEFGRKVRARFTRTD